MRLQMGNSEENSGIWILCGDLKELLMKKMVAAYKEELSKLWEELPPIFITSSSDFRGREELLDYIESINKSL